MIVHTSVRLIEEAKGAGVHVSNSLFVTMLRRRVKNGDPPPVAEEWTPGDREPLQMPLPLGR